MGDYQTHQRLETIAALATASGRGGIGIVRVSGSQAKMVAESLLHQLPTNRQATLCDFYDHEHRVLDKGIAIFFKGPHSFTGEDILELQAHGGPVLLDLLLQQVLLVSGVRQAKPGEFSEQAFLNEKIDLTQAEAIADVIDAASEQAVRSAGQSLQGVFSEKIQALVEALISLRIFVESAIDFPEEEIDFIGNSDVSERLLNIKNEVDSIFKTAQAGTVLREGLQVVIAGQPNVGKSSLLNCLAEKQSAIVTDIPGTTRDVLKEHILIDGIPLHILDTAGLRQSDDVVEQEGVRRAWDEIHRADCVLLLVNDTVGFQAEDQAIVDQFSQITVPMLTVYNKTDASKGVIGMRSEKALGISAKTGAGIESLKRELKAIAGISDSGEGIFIARRRHLDALEVTKAHLKQAMAQLEGNISGELLAEDLRLAQQSLSEITGRFSSDDLLGRIFQDFCIGK